MSQIIAPVKDREKASASHAAGFANVNRNLLNHPIARSPIALPAWQLVKRRGVLLWRTDLGDATLYQPYLHGKGRVRLCAGLRAAHVELALRLGVAALVARVHETHADALAAGRQAIKDEHRRRTGINLRDDWDKHAEVRAGKRSYWKTRRRLRDDGIAAITLRWPSMAKALAALGQPNRTEAADRLRDGLALLAATRVRFRRWYDKRLGIVDRTCEPFVLSYNVPPRGEPGAVEIVLSPDLIGLVSGGPNHSKVLLPLPLEANADALANLRLWVAAWPEGRRAERIERVCARLGVVADRASKRGVWLRRKLQAHVARLGLGERVVIKSGLVQIVQRWDRRGVLNPKP